jgi:signal transduction histidine kinase
VPQVFDRFYRSSTSRQHEVPGTGLGLAITKTIVEQHNGVIDLQSRSGEGTTVTVLLLASDAPGVAAHHDPPAVATSASGESRDLIA